MLIVGLAGGIGSGKSFVAKAFQQLGAGYIDADLVGHDVLRAPETIQELVEQFGSSILDAGGHIDRSAVAKLVFAAPPAGPIALEQLEAVTHPLITAEVTRELQRFRENAFPACVLDAAVMFKSGWDRWCDKIVFVEASPETRWRRVERRGWTREQWEARELSQLALSEKQRRSTDLIFNNGDELVSVPQQVLRLWEQWGLSTKVAQHS